jgi:hypothetical protein
MYAAHVAASTSRILVRARAVPLVGWVAAFTIAELADFATGLAVRLELNPIAAAIRHEPILALALKLALIAFVVATVEICRGSRPGLARIVLVVGTLAGLIGALSNTHLTPFFG